MGEGQTDRGEFGFEAAQPGTVYWTLSLFIDPDRVAAAAGQADTPIRHDEFADLQAQHPPSLLLRDAIEPLFNDIADRDVLGEVQEHLLSAVNVDEPEGGVTPEARRRAVELAVRAPEVLEFAAPAQVRWSTEGLIYNASPPGLDKPRKVQMRRFWMAHNNGALSYHLSFSHRYAGRDEAGEVTGYDPATYYFLSLLQKLAAPKEFKLERKHPATVFDEDLGIAPLDSLTVNEKDGQEERFWPFVKRRMLKDAAHLFDQLCDQTGKKRVVDLEECLIDLVPFIEVPGLYLPKSRFMFLLHDQRFFDRLMPQDPVTGTSAARKAMVQETCYAPYQRRLRTAIEDARRRDGIVRLDNAYWNWVTRRNDYAERIAGPTPILRKLGGEPFSSINELPDAMHRGEAETIVDEQGDLLASPRKMCVPAFEPQRTDCLDYLFLSGFNQNIIDFMNQDTSEILDSIDPIYPESDTQSDERFFVRYANHRAMLTYVPKSRSLETGNDYIGTCPYAFLIHALALHNEFLSRRHESRSLARIERIERLVGHVRKPVSPRLEALVESLECEEPLAGKTAYQKAEIAINQAKFAQYKEHERYRYANPFRYDTERLVFAKLEELRGTQRKKNALNLAMATLEDHASDLQRRQQATTDEAAASRDRMLSFLLGGTGIFGAGQMFYWIGETAAGTAEGDGKANAEPLILDFLMMSDVVIEGQSIMNVTTAAMFYALIAFAVIGLISLGRWLVCWFAEKRRGVD